VGERRQCFVFYWSWATGFSFDVQRG